MKNLFLYSIVLIAFLASCQQDWDEVVVNSPDLKQQLIFHIHNGKPTYSVSRKGKILIKESELGFRLNNLPDLDSNFVLYDKQLRSFDEEWEQPWGEVKTIRNNYSELKVLLREATDSERKMNIIFRVYNDGVAFRYEFPEQEFMDQFQIVEEKTQFVFPAEHRAWWIPAYMPERYEYLYQKTALSEMDTAHSPLTLETKDGLYLCLHEAALYDFPSYTIYPSDTNVLSIDLVPWKSGIKAFVETPFLTPWRSLQIAEKPGDLVTNYQLLNLNDTCHIEDVSWIEPTKYVGIWWGMHIESNTWGSGPKHGATTRETKKFIDFAADNGFGGVLVEGWNTGWDGDWIANGEIFSFTQAYPDFDLVAVTDYAREKGVSLIGHHETSANVENYGRQMEAAYQLYEELGVRYIKTGYVGSKLSNGEWHHGQYGVREYQRSVELAARHKIMLNIHEPIKDCGQRRTWPNLLSREGARGMEYNAWAGDGGNPPAHIPTLVFTRLLSGPMDYTPGIFEMSLPSKPDNQINTTLAKQLAYYVVIYSPLQMAADLPEHYQGNPAFQFIRDVPCDWEDTQVLNGEIGEYVTIVRKDRDSDNWFLGSITNEEPREFSFRLGFLEKGKNYEATIYADGANAHWQNNKQPLEILTKAVTNNDTLFVSLAPGGGQAVMFAITEDKE